MDLTMLRGELIRDVGVRLEAYRDAQGALTVGVGRDLDDNPLSENEITIIGHDCRSLPITEEQAYILLLDDILAAIRTLDKYLPWWKNLDEVRRRVLIHLILSLSLDGLMRLKHTLSMARAGNYDAAADHILQSTWAAGVLERAGRLASMMRTGIA